MKPYEDAPGIFQRSQLLQLLEATLPQEINLQGLIQIVVNRLTAGSSVRVTGRAGVEVGIPQDDGLHWFEREPIHRLRERLFPSNHTPRPLSPTQSLEYPWWVAQCLHYDLPFPLTVTDAEALLGTALVNETLKRSRTIRLIRKRLKRQDDAGKQSKQTERQSDTLCGRKEMNWAATASTGQVGSGQDNAAVVPLRENLIVRAGILPVNAAGKQQTAITQTAWDDGSSEEDCGDYYHVESTLNSPKSSSENTRMRDVNVAQPSAAKIEPSSLR